MSNHQPTYYEVLGVPPSASFVDIVEAYNKIVNEIVAERHVQGTAAYASAKRRLHDVIDAQKALLFGSLRKLENKRIGTNTEHSGEYSQSQPNVETSQTFSTGPNPSHEQQQRDTANGAGPLHPEATSRYMEDETGTTVDVIISTWRLQLQLSPKFRFLNDMSELSDRRDNKTICFEIGLFYNSAAQASYKSLAKDLVVNVEQLPSWIDGVPGSKCGIVRLQTVFKASLHGTPTLTISITAGAQSGTTAGLPVKPPVPWKFGFDCDLSGNIISRYRGTCLIFTADEPSLLYDRYDGIDSPGYILRQDLGVIASHFKNMQSEWKLKMNYGNVEMWRLAAVGWKG